ncbi:putative RING-H2 finger protein ATL21A [Castanea sativa]|uniref:putative RING-H2 finger protein ATL21A n=1 Tax=Castanea sativa TaxID=21020 RepID=UPI003F6517F8
MSIFQVLSLVLFFLFLSPNPIIIIIKIKAAGAGPCPASKCGRNGPSIRFPFQLQSQSGRDNDSNECGYPGFDLSCNSKSQTVVKLPHSGEFFVRSIDYPNQRIELYDPDRCLSRRLLRFNLSGSPFVAAFNQEYVFLRCPSQFRKFGLSVIECLSNSTHSILATSSLILANSTIPSCKVITISPVPVTWPSQYYEGFIDHDLNQDLLLTWYVPGCGDCETQGGVCGFRTNNSTTQQIGCFFPPQAGQLSTGLRIFRIVCFSIALPTITCVIGIACFTCCMESARGSRSNPPAIVTPQRPDVMMGLDESTIQSYEKLVLEESQKLPGPNDNTCPICLSEYCPKDTLRCIPECKHCFHVECIDEWLRMNKTCPVCRKYPSTAHQDTSDIV